MDSHKIISKARKLHARVIGGDGEEKTTAQALLDQYLKDHNLTLDDIVENNKKRFFRIFNEASYNITCFCIRSIAPDAVIETKNKSGIEVVLDDEDYKDSLTKAKYFYDAFLKEQSVFITAFLNRQENNWSPDEYAINKLRELQKKKPKQEDKWEKLNPKDDAKVDLFKETPNVDYRNREASQKLMGFTNAISKLFYKRDRNIPKPTPTTKSQQDETRNTPNHTSSTSGM